MVREADQYFADALERLVTQVLFTKPEGRSPERIVDACGDLRKELALWEAALTGDWLAGPLSAVDFTLYPELRSCFAWGAATPALFRRTSWERRWLPGGAADRSKNLAAALEVEDARGLADAVKQGEPLTVRCRVLNGPRLIVALRRRAHSGSVEPRTAWGENVHVDRPETAIGFFTGRETLSR
jgi:hypothetical protein